MKDKRSLFIIVTLLLTNLIAGVYLFKYRKSQKAVFNKFEGLKVKHNHLVDDYNNLVEDYNSLREKYNNQIDDALWEETLNSSKNFNLQNEIYGYKTKIQQLEEELDRCRSQLR